MRLLSRCAALLGLLWVLPAAAVHTEQYRIPYFGPGYSIVQPDGVRNSDMGQGYQMMVGVPLESGHEAIELRFFDYAITRNLDDKDNFQTGMFLDYVYDFGPLFAGDGFFSGLKPYWSAGGGFVEEDTFTFKHLHFGVDAGGGLLAPLGFSGWALRLDARAVAQSNNESCSDKPGEPGWPAQGGCSKNASFLIDYQAALTLQIPLTLFFDRPVDVAPAEDCPVAVVDPATGRRDCSADSDRDGVSDPNDRCPGTPLGTPVNPEGCAEVKASDDADNDGVKDTADRCPGTHPGLKVNTDGCVVQQTVAMRGVTFQMDSARLTPEGRDTLDQVANTLLSQKELQVEIAGHTDNVGSEAYNMLLSQQRAEAVRAYLIEKGVEDKRLTAVGYGELEPVAGNETENERDQNRRVEFRISAGG